MYPNINIFMSHLDKCFILSFLTYAYIIINIDHDSLRGKYNKERHLVNVLEPTAW